LQKSNDNAQHDGTVVTCPVDELEPGKVYQKLIDNRTEDSLFLDYRTTIVGESIPYVVRKYWRDDMPKMPGTIVRAVATDPREVFSADEMANILGFAREIGMDFGELDILRDNADCRIYIVDANNTPIGPRKELSDRDYHEVLQRMVTAFHEHLLAAQ
jgi:hypothetical protein